jgi:hypothetical protein
MLVNPSVAGMPRRRACSRQNSRLSIITFAHEVDACGIDAFANQVRLGRGLGQ